MPAPSRALNDEKRQVPDEMDMAGLRNAAWSSYRVMRERQEALARQARSAAECRGANSAVPREFIERRGSGL